MDSIITPQREATKPVRDAIGREVAARFEPEMNAAGFWRRLILRWTIRQEIAREMQRRFPPGACYAAASVR
jgi:hypothetical protein